MTNVIFYEYYDCDECSENLILSPPNFNIPPPPIPPQLQNFLDCNKNEEILLNPAENWNTNMKDYIMIYDTRNFNSSPVARTLALCGVFCVILVLTIIISSVYFKRMFKKSKTNNNNIIRKKEERRHTIHDNNKIDISKLHLDSYYEDCYNYYKKYNSVKQNLANYEAVEYVCRAQRRDQFPLPISHYDYYNEATMILILQKEQESRRQQQLYQYPQILFPEHYESTNSRNNFEYSSPYECFHCMPTQCEMVGNKESSCEQSGSRSGSGDSGITSGSNEITIEIPNESQYIEINSNNRISFLTR